jgi:hypothetical protein
MLTAHPSITLTKIPHPPVHWPQIVEIHFSMPGALVFSAAGN